MRFLPPFRIRVLLSTETEEQKERGRPGNEVHGLVHSGGENSVTMSGLVCDVVSHCSELGG